MMDTNAIAVEGEETALEMVDLTDHKDRALEQIVAALETADLRLEDSKGRTLASFPGTANVSVYRRMIDDYRRCKEILDRDFDRIFNFVVGNIVNRRTALTASQVYTIEFFDGLPLSLLKIKQLITLTDERLKQYGLGLSEDVKEYQSRL